MPLTVGTAGHIDHGKTWLVRALTGKDTDRLPEEKERGISIDLGYAALELPDGRRLSVIDVPGHERFVRNMVAGATGIDFFLLVIDATEGARPQTHEHLAILRLLGIEDGVVAVTKADLADPDTLELVVEEARELVPGAAVVPVSAKTGEGLDQLRAALASAAAVSEHSTLLGATRLYLDRVFTLRGIGTVVTGTLWSGSVGEGDELRAEPAGAEVRVRSVQVHDEPVERADAGQRVALALPGIERTALRRGDALVEPGSYPLSYRVDVQLEELEPIGDHARLHVHHGTAEIPARLVRIGDRFAQLRLAEPVVSARGDRFVLRNATTLGGGRVLDPAPPRSSDSTRLELLAEDDPASIVRALVQEPVRGRSSPGAHCFRPLSSTRALRPSNASVTGTSRARGWSRRSARCGPGSRSARKRRLSIRGSPPAICSEALRGAKRSSRSSSSSVATGRPTWPVRLRASASAQTKQRRSRPRSRRPASLRPRSRTLSSPASWRKRAASSASETAWRSGRRPTTRPSEP